LNIENKQLYQLRELKARQPSIEENRLTKTGSQESRDGSHKERQQSVKVVYAQAVQLICIIIITTFNCICMILVVEPSVTKYLWSQLFMSVIAYSVTVQ